MKTCRTSRSRPARLPIALLLLLAGGLARADTQYITDTLTVTLKTSPVGDAKPLGNPLVSGNPVEVLQRSPDGKWARVRFQQVEGWLPAGYLQTTQGAKDRLQELQARFDAMNAEQGTRTQKLTTLEAEAQALRAALQKAESDRDTALQQLGELKIGAAGPEQISQTNLSLGAQVTALKIDNEKLAAEVSRLDADRSADQLFYGGLIVFGGIALGWLMARQSGRRPSGWK